jgi:Domain of unknown function (DUF4157)
MRVSADPKTHGSAPGATAPGVSQVSAALGLKPSRLPPGGLRHIAHGARMPLRRPSQILPGVAQDDSAEADRKTSPVLDVVGKGGGQPLPPGVRADMEGRLGADFSDVRIHTDATAARSAAAVWAKAYTVGNEVVFGQGFFNPGSAAGQHRLAHELSHVQQQRRGAVSGTDTGSGVVISNPSDAFEQEAEATATRSLSGPMHAASVQVAQAPRRASLQRQADAGATDSDQSGIPDAGGPTASASVSDITDAGGSLPGGVPGPVDPQPVPGPAPVSTLASRS